MLGRDLRCVVQGGTTALHIASLWGQHEVIRSLVVAGAHVNVRDVVSSPISHCMYVSESVSQSVSQTISQAV